MVVTRMNTPPVLEPPRHMFVLVAPLVKYLVGFVLNIGVVGRDEFCARE